MQKINPPIGEIYANPAITQRLLDDSGFDIDGYISTEVSEAFAAQEGAAFITGNGIEKPRGLLTYTFSSDADGTRSESELQYVASSGAGAFAASDPSDALFSLIHAVKPRYR